MAEDAEAAATVTSTGPEQDACLLKESAQLRLPPVSLGTLRTMGFFSMNQDSLPRLWKIYVLLIHNHDCKVEDLLRWSEEKIFPEQAQKILGQDSEDVKWLRNKKPSWNPNDGDIWRLPGLSWYECVQGCIGLGDLSNCRDQSLQEKQRAYIAYAVLLLRGWAPDPRGVEKNIDVWHDFGFNTCLSSDEREELKDYYSLALLTRSVEPKKDGIFTPFEVFLQHYRYGTLIPWLNEAIKREGIERDINQEFPWLTFFLSKADDQRATAVRNWSVWRLRQLQRIVQQWDIPSVLQGAASDYGLIADRNRHALSMRSVKALLKVYVEIMEHGPDKLYEAREEGRLASYVSEMSQKADIPVQPWMTAIFNDLDDEQKRKANPGASPATGKPLGGHSQ